jgi:hypothetical protein
MDKKRREMRKEGERGRRKEQRKFVGWDRYCDISIFSALFLFLFSFYPPLYYRYRSSLHAHHPIPIV